MGGHNHILSKLDKPTELEGGKPGPGYLWALLSLIELELPPVTIVLCLEALLKAHKGPGTTGGQPVKADPHQPSHTHTANPQGGLTQRAEMLTRAS